jgi:hypothetical protein
MRRAARVRMHPCSRSRRSGDIFARIGSIPVFNFAGNLFFSSRDFAIADADIFSFVVPESSVLSLVTVEFGAFEFTGPLVGFGLFDPARQ